MSCCSCFAACSDNDLYSDSSRKTCWQFTNYSLTSQNVVNLLHPHSKTDKIFCQSVFVKGRNWGTWRCRSIPGCHTPPWLISIGLSWRHLTHDRQRPSLPLIPGEHIWQPADLTDSLLHWRTGWLTDDPAVKGWGSTQMISKEDKQAADSGWWEEWEKFANGTLLCLGSSLHCYTPKLEPFVTRLTPTHTAAAPPQSPCKLGKSEIAAEREEKQRCGKTQRD